MRLTSQNALVGGPLDFSASNPLWPNSSDPTNPMGAAFRLGTIIEASDTLGTVTTANVPNWGQVELLYVANRSSSTFIPGRLVHVDKDFGLLDMPNTGNTGRPVAVCLTHFSAGNVTPQGGWVLLSGMCPVSYSVAATAGAVYFAAAGQATPTLTAGKQIVNATCLIAASGSFTRPVTTVTGSSRVAVPSLNGVYVGQAISGTGIPASSVVSAIPAGDTAVIIGSAIGTPVAATASATVTGTFTHTGYGICLVNRPFVQGNIT